MPRDATDTKARLLAEAERLFATRGYLQATTREITQAAGQRNASALTYHFGSRDGVLRAILAHHSPPLDDLRAALVDEPLDAMPDRALMAALLLPYSTCLATEGGRNYLRIVAQMSDRFADWRLEDDELHPPVLRRILTLLEGRIEAPEAVARERVDSMIMLMTVAMAERARGSDSERAPALDDPTFLANLADMLVGCLVAPAGPPLAEPAAAPPSTRRARQRR